jgi:adenosylmethionine-8-amino-7-oxononanoate aminotransferase
MLLKNFFISALQLFGHGRQHADDTAQSQFDSFNYFNKDAFSHETIP